MFLTSFSPSKDNWVNYGSSFVSNPSYFLILEGLGHEQDQHSPVLLLKEEPIKMICCGGGHSMILKANGELVVFGRNLMG